MGRLLPGEFPEASTSAQGLGWEPEEGRGPPCLVISGLLRKLQSILQESVRVALGSEDVGCDFDNQVKEREFPLVIYGTSTPCRRRL